LSVDSKSGAIRGSPRIIDHCMIFCCLRRSAVMSVNFCKREGVRSPGEGSISTRRATRHDSENSPERHNAANDGILFTGGDREQHGAAERVHPAGGATHSPTSSGADCAARSLAPPLFLHWPIPFSIVYVTFPVSADSGSVQSAIARIIETTGAVRYDGADREVPARRYPAALPPG